MLDNLHNHLYVNIAIMMLKYIISSENSNMEALERVDI